MQLGISGWRLRGARLRLTGEVCAQCDQKIFPPRDVCPNCGDKAEKEFKKQDQYTNPEPRVLLQVLVEEKV